MRIQKYFFDIYCIFMNLYIILIIFLTCINNSDLNIKTYINNMLFKLNNH